MITKTPYPNNKPWRRSGPTRPWGTTLALASHYETTRRSAIAYQRSSLRSQFLNTAQSIQKAPPRDTTPTYLSIAHGFKFCRYNHPAIWNPFTRDSWTWQAISESHVRTLVWLIVALGSNLVIPVAWQVAIPYQSTVAFELQKSMHEILFLL